MTELRRVRKVGGSLTLTIPPDTIFVEGDWVKFDTVDGGVLLRKVVV